MFGEERYFSDARSGEEYAGIVFEFGNGEGLQVPYSQLEIGSSVRGMQLVGSGSVLAMDSESDYHPEFHVMSSSKSVSSKQPAAILPSFKRVACQPRIVPAIPLNQSFDIVDSVEVVVASVERVLRQIPGLEMSFVASEFMWSCQQVCGVTSTEFEVRLYRYAAKHAKAGSLMVEMQRNFGDRMQYFAIYDSVRSQILGNSDGVGSDDAQIEFEPLPMMSEDNAAMSVVGEDDIKLTLLAVIVNYATAEYKTLLEAVQLVGTIFAQMYGLPQFSAMDLQLLAALEVLSLNHPQFYCIHPFVTEKKLLVSRVSCVNVSTGASTLYQSAVFVR